MLIRFALLTLTLLLSLPTPGRAQATVDTLANRHLRRYGLEESQVMETLRQLTDVYGPRLTGSPRLDSAAAWAQRQLKAWGAARVGAEAWGPFGRGWQLRRFDLNILEPAAMPLIAYPQAWSAPIPERTAREVVLLDAPDAAALEAYRGRLKGKLVLVDDTLSMAPAAEPLFRRRTPEELLRLANAPISPPSPRRYSEAYRRQYEQRQARLRFLYGEQPLALLDRSSQKGGYGTVYVAAASVPAQQTASGLVGAPPWSPEAGAVLPQISLAEEEYNRLYRLLKNGAAVRAEIELDADYIDDDPMERNVVAEIPGADPSVAEEVVMLGAHLDSWHAGSGASDNAAGCAVMMEAFRMLQRLFDETALRPRRTIRLALWTGEEQGLYGSRAYVRQHFTEGSGASVRPAYEQFSAYYNLDNGAGRIRGIYAQGNPEASLLFRTWLGAFADLEAATVSLANTGSTDHISFDEVGLPGFQFIQDPLDYGKHYHSNMDVFDHAPAGDLKQAATVIASVVYHTAQHTALMPRKASAAAAPASR